MPIASGPSLPDNRHLAVPNLSRNDSLKSERSDKRVSFNNDVGIKHIPRGATKGPAPLPPVQKVPPDEWAGCKPVKLQPNNLTVEELEQEAAHLVDLVDSINCKASPLPSKKNKEFSSRSLDRSQKRNDIRNGQGNGVNYTRITNPIIRHLKADVNRRDNRRRDLYSDSESDRQRAARHKSVPNLIAATYSNGTNGQRLFNGVEHTINYSSVDNLLDEKNTNIIHAGKEPRRLHSSHHSADSLLDSSNGKSNLVGYKSLGNLPSSSDSDSTDMSYGYRPKVNQIIQRFNGDPENKYRSTDLSSERESSPTRGVIAPTRRQRYNNNKPFSYTDATQDNHIQSTRRTSPFRTLPNEDMYAQVNKHGLRQRLSMDSDYSAKIIITEDRPKNSYEGDDEAYETYQVQNNTIRNNRYSDYGLNLSRDDINSKNNVMNNNINMSSVAVQTDTVNKALNKDRRPTKGMAPQPPIHDAYRENARSKKDLSSELSSANLVRQVNHGFGRFDRSPSPPPRKAFNRSNQHHVIPLLSDTSDSETEHRRRSDPLAKIRNQVLMGERLQEEHDAEEWEEREMAQYERNKKNLNFHPGGMRPLTLDEVDALSLELDQHGNRNLVVSQKTGERRSSSQQITQHSNVTGSNIERSYSEDRSRPFKPLREKNKSNRDSSASRTLERNKKNNLEKEKLAQEKKTKEIEKELEKKKEKDTLKSKNKDKKNKDKDTIKDKKKKRIKIKFFYDPRPQDKTSDDPLSRFTEYKGNERKENNEKTSTLTSKTIRSRSQDSRSQSRERNGNGDVSIDPRYGRESSRERTLSKPDRSRKSAASNDRLHYGRGGSSSHEESNDDRRRVRSTDSFDKRDRSENYNSRDDRRMTYDIDRDERFNKNRRGYDNDKMNDYTTGNGNSRDSYDSYLDDATQRRATFLERREAYERRDSSVSRRDSVGPRKDSIEERRNIYNDKPNPSRDQDIEKYNSSPDEQDKQERVMRQRNKFLSVILSDGRAKSSNFSPTTNNNVSSTTNNSKLDNSNHSYSNDGSTLKRTQSSAKQKPDRYTFNKLGHTSDPQPPASVTSSNKSPTTSKKQNSPKKPKKKKKKSWSWGFLGLRGNTRKQRVSPPSRAGSEVGSTVGTTLKRGNPLLNQYSRPTSRSSSHRSSTRPTRPSVRSSKIRKDAGETRQWASRVHDQRETRHWESATLQRPVGGSRDRNGSGDRRPMKQGPSGRQARAPRRTSEGSSGSSGGEQRVGRQPSFKQRYFGDSDHDSRPRNTSGPGDYRSLPTRTIRGSGVNKRGGTNSRLRGVGGGGSAGSSLQSSESENDSHQGSRASHVSTGSNRSVYLHATAVADIPVQKGDELEKQGVQRQTRKVTRSFSMLAPWKPRHAREAQQSDYDNNRDTRHAAKPPRPPRRSADNVGRSQTFTNKDSKLSGWLKKRKSKEGKGI